MENKKFNYFRLAAVCFAISGLCFVISSMMNGGSTHLPLGMSLVVLGMVLSGRARKFEQEQQQDGKSK
ncbi:MAG: hypothetical protein ACI4AH_00115 [Muribaculaceae bacterium]